MSLVFKFRGKILILLFIERYFGLFDYDWSMMAAIIEFYNRNSIYVHIAARIVAAVFNISALAGMLL